MHKGLPTSKGLYDSRYEHDACGVGLLVNIKGVKSHQLVEKGLQVLEHMVHRGAEGADPKTGDGAGIMVQIPHEFILLQGIAVPEKGRYGTGLVFLPKDEYIQQTILDIIERAMSPPTTTNSVSWPAEPSRPYDRYSSPTKAATNRWNLDCIYCADASRRKSHRLTSPTRSNFIS